jgi:hypothetical protein
MARKKSTEKELRWRDIMDRQADSGLSIRRFCANEGISQPSFYAWRRKIREQNGTDTRPRKSSRRMDEPGSAAFIPLKLLDSAGTLEVIHPLGCQVRISGVVNTIALKQVLGVLDERGHA